MSKTEQVAALAPWINEIRAWADGRNPENIASILLRFKEKVLADAAAKKRRRSAWERTLVSSAALAECRKLADLYQWHPYAIRKHPDTGEDIEVISYPWPDEDGKIFVNVRLIPGDPTSMVKLELEVV